MKKVMKGARYDTNTAKLIADWESDQDYTGPSHVSEYLYRTKAEKWFLHGVGNSATAYASRNADGLAGPGEQIIPLSDNAARQWAEQHLTDTEVEYIFDTLYAETTQVAAYLPADLLKKLDTEKASSGRSRSDIIIDALRKYL